MKKNPFSLAISVFLTSLAGVSVSSLQAQTSLIDTVTITAPDSAASEAGPDPGRFEIHRSGPTNYSLSVFYRIGGTASNGVDYEQISGAVSIPAGQFTTSIPIKPIDDTLVEGTETVVLQIVPSPLLCPAPACGYNIGWPSNAVVTIADDDQPRANVNIYAADPVATEQSPLVDAAPDTATFTVRRGFTNTSIAVYYEISGTASNGVDYEKLSGQLSIPEGAWSADIVVTPIDDTLVEGTETVVLTLVAPCPQCLFANPPCEVLEGTNCYPIGPDIRAVAYIRDNDSSPSNSPPTVRIATPSDGSVFAAPADIDICAQAFDSDGYVATVEFFEGANSLGVTTNNPASAGVRNPFCLRWTNVPPGNYVLTAKATDSGGAMTVSAPVKISVITETNPPIVTIFAIDPIAVEGQFCVSNWWWTSSGSTGGVWTTASPGWRTNYCSTNTATFAVRRTGETNLDLTVYYAIGGTASNAVDYLTLPGQVTIPAGHYAARITVTPIDDGIPECIETVLLALEPPPVATPNAAPAYLVGVPSRAAAIILDNGQPRPACQCLSDGLFHLCMPGTNGYSFCIRASRDLLNWTSLCTNVVTEGAVHFVDPDATGFGQRFYQIAPAPNYSTPE